MNLIHAKSECNVSLSLSAVLNSGSSSITSTANDCIIKDDGISDIMMNNASEEQSSDVKEVEEKFPRDP